MTRAASFHSCSSQAIGSSHHGHDGLGIVGEFFREKTKGAGSLAQKILIAGLAKTLQVTDAPDKTELLENFFHRGILFVLKTNFQLVQKRRGSRKIALCQSSPAPPK